MPVADIQNILNDATLSPTLRRLKLKVQQSKDTILNLQSYVDNAEQAQPILGSSAPASHQDLIAQQNYARETLEAAERDIALIENGTSAPIGTRQFLTGRISSYARHSNSNATSQIGTNNSESFARLLLSWLQKRTKTHYNGTPASRSIVDLRMVNCRDDFYNVEDKRYAAENNSNAYNYPEINFAVFALRNTTEHDIVGQLFYYGTAFSSYSGLNAHLFTPDSTVNAEVTSLSHFNSGGYNSNAYTSSSLFILMPAHKTVTAIVTGGAYKPSNYYFDLHLRIYDFDMLFPEGIVSDSEVLQNLDFTQRNWVLPEAGDAVIDNLAFYRTPIPTS